MGDTSASSPLDYQFTCNRCDYRGNPEAEPDWVRIVANTESGYKWVEVDKYPLRCTPCDTHYRRYKRSRRNLERAINLAMEYRQGYPKMITVTLPSVPDDPRTLKDQLKELLRKWGKFRKFHCGTGTWLGGIYCVESTLKVNFDRDKGPWFGIKHHAHIHAVVICPFYSKKKLIEFSESGYDFGLGRASVRGRPSGVSGSKFAKHLAHYMSKYITKGHVGVRSANFGMLIGRPWPKRGHAQDSTSG
jgi:hypothetical protein